uniref:Universal stress protein n=1 Tax=Angiostrongylus cantonensis TaxID=6313 RepID=A0A0K0DL96_ANGCA
MNISLKRLFFCFQFLKNTPEEYMTNIILYIDTLQYNSIPDYDHIATQLETAAKAYYLNFAAPPDWDLMAEYKGPKYEKNVAEGMGKAIHQGALLINSFVPNAPIV